MAIFKLTDNDGQESNNQNSTDRNLNTKRIDEQITNEQITNEQITNEQITNEQSINQNEDSTEDNTSDKEHEDKETIREFGQTKLEKNSNHYKIHLLNVIGEIEGHDCLSSNTKTTKYEHVIPMLTQVEDDDEIDGLLMILNTVGGDVECGLAIAEMVASMSKPTVSLVLGGSHSIGVPLAVSTDYSFIVPSGTMVIHPVRMNGLFIGVPQTYDYFKRIQQRINVFVTSHCGITEQRFNTLMTETEVMTKDVGSILVGGETVDKKIIDEIGGLKEAMNKLYELIEKRRSEINNN